MKKPIAGIVITLFFSCNQVQLSGINTGVEANNTISVTVTTDQDTIALEEYFVDSINIGVSKFNKVEFSKFRGIDSVYADINFYSKQKGRWLLKNSYHFLKDGVVGCDPQISDFNNDGNGDFTFVSSVAARGANEIRTLFIYNKKLGTLMLIRNSSIYPNLLYNKELNCIDAFRVYGGCTTEFLRIEADSLKPFASVSLFDGLTISEYNNGKEKTILEDTAVKENYVRYINYKPLKAYKHF